MKKLTAHFIFIFSLLFNSQTFASEGGFKTELENIASPFTTDARYYLLGGAAITYGTYRYNKESDRTLESRVHAEEKDWWTYGELLGSGVLQALYVLPRYFYGKSTNNKKAIQDAEVMTKTSIYTSTTTLLMKLAIGQGRPDAPDRGDSFPSGHASSTFAFATVIATRHAWYWGLGAYALAAISSLPRIQDGSHYVHDAIGGAVWGITYGMGVYLKHEQGLPFLLTAAPPTDKKPASVHVTFTF